MKKGLVLALVVLISVSVFADDKELGYYAAGISETVLFPEGNFNTFPSRLTTMEQGLLQINPEIYLNNLGKTVNTIPSGAVNEGASETFKNADFRFGLDGMYFTELSDGFVLGFALDTGMTFDTNTNEEDDGYTTAGEKFTVVEKDNSFVLSPVIYGAFDLGGLTIGARIYSNNNFDPAEEEFEQTTDSLQNNGNMFYSTTFARSISNHSIGGQISVGSEIDSLEWVASVGGSYYAENTVDYQAVDSDGDGFEDSIMDFISYVMAPLAEGGLGQAYYDELMQTKITSLNVNGYAKMELENRNALIFSLSWNPLYNSEYSEYFRNAVADRDILTETFSGTPLNFNLSAAYDMKISERSSLRAGIGAGFTKYEWNTTDLDALGVTNFNILNTNNYSEVTWGADPANGQVIAAASADLGPSSYSVFSIPINLSFRIMPAKTVTLFSGLSGSFVHQVLTYNVFDDADNTVWTEETSYTGIDLSNLELIGGIEFMFNDNATLLVGTRFDPFNASFNGTGDPIPTRNDVDTTDVTQDISTSSDGDFSLDITLTFRY